MLGGEPRSETQHSVEEGRGWEGDEGWEGGGWSCRGSCIGLVDPCPTLAAYWRCWRSCTRAVRQGVLAMACICLLKSGLLVCCCPDRSGEVFQERAIRKS